jgi:hypothetical protein
MTLEEAGECIFDAEQLKLSHGYEWLDSVGREAFVNHVHFNADDREVAAAQTIEMWIAEMRTRWPDRVFRIYRQFEPHEITIRFHAVRPGMPNWCEEEVEVIIVGY